MTAMTSTVYVSVLANEPREEGMIGTIIESTEESSSFQPIERRFNCSLWAVLTTVFPPSEAVRRLLHKSDWCLVVVGDLNKPAGDYMVFTTVGHDRAVFLSGEEQVVMQHFWMYHTTLSTKTCPCRSKRKARKHFLQLCPGAALGARMWGICSQWLMAPRPSGTLTTTTSSSSFLKGRQRIPG